MAEPRSRGSTPSVLGVKRTLEEDHAPTVPSPLNPDAASKSRPARPPAREQREKKDSLKKRESAAGNTRTFTPATKQKGPTAPSPVRYGFKPQTSHYDPPKEPSFATHEPHAFYTPNGGAELKKPIDQ